MMKPEGENAQGEKRQVRRAQGMYTGSSSQVIGAFNAGGASCDVVYRTVESHASEPRPAGFQVRADGTVCWPSGERATAAGSESVAASTSHELAVRPRYSEGAPSWPMSRQPQGVDQPPPPTELQKIHGLLRGRYPLAICLALVLGMAGVWAGLKLGQKIYQSQGLISIIRVDLFPKPESAESTEQFMEAQAAKLKGQRVMDAALDDPEWRRLGRNRSDEVEAAFVKQLEVTAQGQMLVVKFADPDPQAAAIAVQSTMKAFKGIFDEEQRNNGVFAQDQMTAAASALRAKLSNIQADMDAVAVPYGPDALEVQRTIKLQELHDYEKAKGDLEQGQAEIPATDPIAATQPAAMSVEQIARIDPSMQSLLGKRSQTEDEIAGMQAAHYLEEYPKLKTARLMLAAVEQEISQRAGDWKSMHEAGLLGTPTPGTTLTPEQRKLRITYFEKCKTEADKQLADLSEKIRQVNKDKLDKDPIQSDLNVAEQWLQKDELQKTAWRVELTDADRPLSAYRDTRITFAGAGGFGGLVLGAGLVLLLGLLDRRVRHPEDAINPSIAGSVLGMLPELPEDLSDPDQAAMVAHGVHGVRTLLQIWGQGQNHQVFGVSSSAAGSGKTSLVLALGISYASARFKTLLIDCDLVGKGLTTRVDAIVRRKIGSILTRGGLLDERQLPHALQLARQSGRRLGEVLLELGCITEKDLDAAVQAQLEQPLGLLDALGGEDLQECVAQTSVEGLWVLPLGNATALHAGTLSPAALHGVVAAAREHFDIVIIDTGPIPGSLEASLVASQADAMILAVARGDHKSEIERSVLQLRALGANLAGVVFNRARPRDLVRYGSSGAHSSGSFAAVEMQRENEVSCSRLGPVARAVASFAPAGGFVPTTQN